MESLRAIYNFVFSLLLISDSLVRCLLANNTHNQGDIPFQELGMIRNLLVLSAYFIAIQDLWCWCLILFLDAICWSYLQKKLAFNWHFSQENVQFSLSWIFCDVRPVYLRRVIEFWQITVWTFFFFPVHFWDQQSTKLAFSIERPKNCANI